MPKIQFRRGNKNGLPALSPGEPALTLNTSELFIGGQNGNLQIPVLDQDGKVPEGQLPPDGSAAVQEALDEHVGDKNNPHEVTAAQVGASLVVKGTYPIASGQSISAGDVVDVVEGEISREVQSKDAIALQSGEAGDSIEVIFSGTTAADWATAGQEITSPGVGGYAPLDDMLWVNPWWASKFGTTVQTGSYVGTGFTGSSSPNTIKFNKRPDVVFVQPFGNITAIASFMCIVVTGLTSSASNWNALSFAKGSGSSTPANGYEIYASYDDAENELSWFGTREAMYQQNISGMTYNYVAIG